MACAALVRYVVDHILIGPCGVGSDIKIDVSDGSKIIKLALRKSDVKITTKWFHGFVEIARSTHKQTFLHGCDFGFLYRALTMVKIGMPKQLLLTLNELGLLYVAIRDSNISEDLPSHDDTRSDKDCKKERIDTLAETFYEEILNCDDVDIEVGVKNDKKNIKPLYVEKVHETMNSWMKKILFVDGKLPKTVTNLIT
eukprot:UN23070